MRSKTHEPALVQAPARLRANVPSYRLRAASYVLRHGVVGSRGETPSLPFLCRRFFSQTEKKCRNAGSIYCLIIVGREGNSQYKQIKIVVSASADSGQPQGLSLRTIGNRHLSLSRQQCVEVTAPYKLRIKKFRQISRADNIRPTA